MPLGVFFSPKEEKIQEESECHHDNSDGTNNNNRRKVGPSLSVSDKHVFLLPCLPVCVSLQTVCPAVGEHPLQYNYTFWYSRRTPSRPASSQSYEQNIRQIGTVASVLTCTLLQYILILCSITVQSVIQ